MFTLHVMRNTSRRVVMNESTRFFEECNNGISQLLDGKCKEFRVKLPGVPKIVKDASLKPKKKVNKKNTFRDRVKLLMNRDG